MKFLFKKNGKVELQECDSIQSPCMNCNQTVDQCDICIYNFDNKNQCKTCLTGYYSNDKDLHFCQKCSDVLENCADCENTFTCKKCDKNYKLIENDTKCQYTNEEDSTGSEDEQTDPQDDDDQEKNPKKLSVGQIIGIVVGVFIAVVAIIGSIFFYIWYKKKQLKQKQEDQLIFDFTKQSKNSQEQIEFTYQESKNSYEHINY